MVKKWKKKALISFAFSTVITIMLVVVWINKWWFSLNTWDKLEKIDLIKWVGIILGLLWNGFIIKSLYDRFLDPSKEKAYRESLWK
jgi:ABC-type transport system involved in cytochrome c biogenesis permease subunit